jgi:hypothetical protein
MVETAQAVQPEMLRITNLDQRNRWLCAVFTLFAVCSLTVSVTTRYCSIGGVWSPANVSARIAPEKQVMPEPSRQRMNNDAAAWVPPVVRALVLQAPAVYPRVAPAGPPIPEVVFEKSLYNRPPPSSISRA